MNSACTARFSSLYIATKLQSGTLAMPVSGMLHPLPAAICLLVHARRLTRLMAGIEPPVLNAITGLWARDSNFQGKGNPGNFFFNRQGRQEIRNGMRESWRPWG
jgi:hypothetical protein